MLACAAQWMQYQWFWKAQVGIPSLINRFGATTGLGAVPLCKPMVYSPTFMTMVVNAGLSS